MKNLDLNDHARLRHHRDRYLGIPTNKQIQPAPMLFNRDGLNLFYGDMYKGSSAFLILGGPSFGELIKGNCIIHDKVVPNIDALKYPGFVTMATNNSPRSFRTDMWVSVDDPGNFMKSIWLDPKITKFVPFDHTEKRIFDNEKWEHMDKLVSECPNVNFFRRNEHFNPSQFLIEGTFNWGEHSNSIDALGNKGGRSVMLVALKLLYYLGIRNVFLLGCDFHMSDNSKYHFEQDRSDKSQKGNNQTYEILKSRFQALKPYFDAVGFNVYNCNEKSGLKVFPYKSFQDAINMSIKDMPDISVERTEGLYDRQANERNAAKSTVDTSKKEYTEEDKRISKNKLDGLRKVLNDLKHSREMYMMMPDANPENIKKIDESINNARKNFREYEIIKNKIWGITK